MKLAKGSEITTEYLASLSSKHDWFDIRLADEDLAKQLELIKLSLQQKTRRSGRIVRNQEEKTDPRRRIAAWRTKNGESLYRHQTPSASR